jgi:hypothetical protein
MRPHAVFTRGLMRPHAVAVTAARAEGGRSYSRAMGRGDGKALGGAARGGRDHGILRARREQALGRGAAESLLVARAVLRRLFVAPAPQGTVSHRIDPPRSPARGSEGLCGRVHSTPRRTPLPPREAPRDIVRELVPLPRAGGGVGMFGRSARSAGGRLQSCGGGRPAEGPGVAGMREVVFGRTLFSVENSSSSQSSPPVLRRARGPAVTWQLRPLHNITTAVVNSRALLCRAAPRASQRERARGGACRERRSFFFFCLSLRAAIAARISCARAAPHSAPPRARAPSRPPAPASAARRRRDGRDRPHGAGWGAFSPAVFPARSSTRRVPARLSSCPRRTQRSSAPGTSRLNLRPHRRPCTPRALPATALRALSPTRAPGASRARLTKGYKLRGDTVSLPMESYAPRHCGSRSRSFLLAALRKRHAQNTFPLKILAECVFSSTPPRLGGPRRRQRGPRGAQRRVPAPLLAEDVARGLGDSWCGRRPDPDPARPGGSGAERRAGRAARGGTRECAARGGARERGARVAGREASERRGGGRGLRGLRGPGASAGDAVAGESAL